LSLQKHGNYKCQDYGSVLFVIKLTLAKIELAQNLALWWLPEISARTCLLSHIPYISCQLPVIGQILGKQTFG
jgi:hypothetical protein